MIGNAAIAGWTHGGAAEWLTASSVERGSLHSDTDFEAWWAGRQRALNTTVRPVSLANMEGWYFDADSGDLLHRSGRFFSIGGIRVFDGDSMVGAQPIMDQPDIAILGMLVKDFDGVPHCLVQAKVEPGNANGIQLSPTVQATRSNYTRIHGGSAPPYLEYFRGEGRGRILVDVLQSEHGMWFWKKHNRNIVVRVTGDVPPHEDFIWLTVRQIRELLSQDDLVNMDTRTVLSCMPIAPSAGDGGSGFAGALRRSYGAGPGLHSLGAIMSWLTDARTRCEVTARRIPLVEVEGWSLRAGELVDDDGRSFRVVGVRVEAERREVARWSQPLLALPGVGRVAFVVRSIGGVAHVLVRARAEPGLLGGVEIGPTLRRRCDRDLGESGAARTAGIERTVAETTAAVRYDVVLSEEGGRFYHGQARYQIIEVDERFPVRVPEDYCWLTAGQLVGLLQHGHYVNIEARTLLACLHNLWS